MSGGVAYLYDPVEARINTEMVDVEALDDADETIVRDLLVRHRRETGSTVAARLYTDWDTVRGSFRKVMPRDYKRVLTAIRQAQEQGLVADEVIMAAARG
jgi:glutamate synthase (NADPH/NADH) large chain